MKLEQAARQALEALETLDCGDSYKTHNAATALREALAEQACPNGCDTSNGRCVDCPDSVSEQTEQEPVACIIHTEEGDYVDWNSKGYCFYIGETPLYAAPVRTKDLTDEEKQFYVDKWERTTDYPTVDYLIDAVIAADRSKNGIV